MAMVTRKKARTSSSSSSSSTKTWEELNGEELKNLFAHFVKSGADGKKFISEVNTSTPVPRSLFEANHHPIQ